jgi:hypothetical protein
MKNAVQSQLLLLQRIDRLKNDTISDEIINDLKIQQPIIDVKILE